MRQHCTSRWLVGLLAVIMAGTGIVLGCASASQEPAKHRPTLTFDPSVGSDLQALAQQTWEQFLTVFEARATCFGDVRLRAAYQLDSRASYDPDTATVTVRVPGTPAMLQSALIHEWAHHIEYQCPEQKDLRPAFLAAQGLEADTPWRPDDTPANVLAGDWAGTPSEQFAEATIELVLGRRPIPTNAFVTKAAVGVIAEWAKGD
jgi:hypothetical protein